MARHAEEPVCQDEEIRERPMAFRVCERKMAFGKDAITPVPYAAYSPDSRLRWDHRGHDNIIPLQMISLREGHDECRQRYPSSQDNGCLGLIPHNMAAPPAPKIVGAGRTRYAVHFTSKQ